MATTTVAVSSVPFAVMSRPQIGIDRLPVNRRPSNEPKEAMNCKSCRKRKIKCNRLKPTCEACQVFNCACVYDAVPKKRGPKTELLETLLKRVNGLEKRLQDKEGNVPFEDESAVEDASSTSGTKEPEEERSSSEPTVQRPNLTARAGPIQEQVSFRAPQPASTSFTNALIDTYFARLHGKPYYILDEPATRQRLRDGLLPQFLVHAIYAVSVRYVSHLCGGHSAAVQQSVSYAAQSRFEIDMDEPSIDHLQALLLLSMASFQSGWGKKSYMLLSHAVSMALALNLHRELPAELRIASNEREGRRKLFWTCYLMDHLSASGSKRPSLISDEAVYLRLPAGMSSATHAHVDGNYFPNGSSLAYAAGMSNAAQGSGAMLIEVVRILGVTNRYIAAGGVKGDCHFPWHTQSTLSRIRSNLDEWAATTQDAFSTVDSLFGQPDSTTLVLSKLIYHLIHCLIYRPFLPVDLMELSGTGQHQSWQIEATNLCFLHANAIAELVEIGKNTSIIDWPAFVGYCICTAGTIHVHGTNYISSQEGDIFDNSSDFLSREMVQLADLRYIWAGVRHQWQTLQLVITSHLQLIDSLSSNPMRFSPVFQMEDFFDRYSGYYIDGSYISFTDVDADGFDDSYIQTASWTKGRCLNLLPPDSLQAITRTPRPMPSRPTKKRRTISDSVVNPIPNSDFAAATPDTERRATLPDPSQPAAEQPNAENKEPEAQDQNNDPDRLQPDSFTQTALSPGFGFSPMPQPSPFPNTNGNGQWDTFYSGQRFDYQSPSGFSNGGDSALTDPDKDPFLGLLEQLAQNEEAVDGDFFMKGDRE